MTKAAATTYRTPAGCTDVGRLLAQNTTNRPATRNQYGEIYTGTPNGRAMTMPYLASRRAPGGGGSSGRCACWRSCSGVMPVTPRCYVLQGRGERLQARGN